VIDAARTLDFPVETLDERDAERYQTRIRLIATSTLRGEFAVVLLNISATGGLIQAPFKLRPGSEIAIIVDGSMIYVGSVTWYGYGFAGLRFSNRIPDEVVSFLVALSGSQG
jgi:hypothetical protein